MKRKYLVFYALSSSSSAVTQHSSGFFDLGLKIENQEHLDMLTGFIKDRVNMKGIYISITGIYDVSPEPKVKSTKKTGYTLPTKRL
jgi:hypothetical protein